MARKFLVKFTKLGYVKYISHLDLLRVFKRTIKMRDIKLKYSEGFNPHPKMSFVQPLSLGYSSKCELLEFETSIDYESDDLKERLDKRLPEGVDIIYLINLCTTKPLAGFVESCEYMISFKSNKSYDNLNLLLSRYLAQDEIIAIKKSKKEKEEKEVSIKNMIRSIKLEKNNDTYNLICNLDQGSNSNLSPELVIQTFLKYTDLGIDRSEIDVERLSISFSNNFQF